MTPQFRGLAFSARSGTLQGVGIEAGTPREDAIAALREAGFDEDVVAALSSCGPVAKSRASAIPSAIQKRMDALLADDPVETARHDVRHPTTGQYAPKPTPTALAPWKHGGAVHPSVAQLPAEETTKSDPVLERVRAEFRRLLILDRGSTRIS